MAANDKHKTTIATLNRYKKEGRTIVAVSAYDFWQSQLCNQAGIDVVLVGDSAAMTQHGHATTIPITMDEMISHAQAVSRGNSGAFLIGDLPYGTYSNINDAVKNSERFIVSGMDAIKLEGNQPEQVRAISKAGILVMSHLGLTPHTRAKLGGYRVQGKTKADADIILDQAKSLQDAGAFAILLEAVPTETAQYIQDNLEIMCWGIGGGNNLHGQLIIFHDLVGLFSAFKSKFVKRYCQAGDLITKALSDYASEVRSGIFPAKENFYEIKEEELEALLADHKWKFTKNELIRPDLGQSPGC